MSFLLADIIGFVPKVHRKHPDIQSRWISSLTHRRPSLEVARIDRSSSFGLTLQEYNTYQLTFA